MKFICDASELANASTQVQRAVSSKSTLPALEGILIRASGDALTLTGYDLELAITTEIPANIQREGGVVVNAKLFLEILRKVPGEMVHIEVDDKLAVNITSDSAAFFIMGMDEKEFPELPEVAATDQLEMDTALLSGMVAQTVFASSTSDIKPVHMGLLFEIDAGEIRVIAVDGFRLAVRREAISQEAVMRFIIPAKTLSELLRLKGEEDKTIGFQLGTRHAAFGVGKFHVVSRLLQGDFLDYRSAIPDGASTTVKVSTRAFHDAIDRMALMITDRLKSPVCADFGDGHIALKCVTAMGKAIDDVKADISGDSLQIGFNCKYFLDALKAADTDMVRIEFNGPTAPIKILPPEGDAFVFLVLPVRLKAE